MVQERLLARKGQVLFVPEDRALPGLDFVWEVQDRTLRGQARFGGQQVEFEKVSAVLARSYGVLVSPGTFATTDGRYVSGEWNALLMAWLASLSCIVVNRLQPELWYRVSLNVTALAALVPDAPFKRLRTTQHPFGRTDRAGAARESLAVLQSAPPRSQVRTALSLAADLRVERAPLVFPARSGPGGQLFAWTAALSFCSGLCALAVSSAFEVAVPRWAILAYGASCVLQALLAPALGMSWQQLRSSVHPGYGLSRSEHVTASSGSGPLAGRTR